MPRWYRNTKIEPDGQLPPVARDTSQEGPLQAMSRRCESYNTKAAKIKKTLYNRQMQQEIITHMCCEINKGNKFRAMQLGM